MRWLRGFIAWILVLLRRYIVYALGVVLRAISADRMSLVEEQLARLLEEENILAYFITFDLSAPTGVAAIACAVSGNLATSGHRPSRGRIDGASRTQQGVSIRKTRVHTPDT